MAITTINPSHSFGSSPYGRDTLKATDRYILDGMWIKLQQLTQFTIKVLPADGREVPMENAN